MSVRESKQQDVYAVINISPEHAIMAGNSTYGTRSVSVAIDKLSHDQRKELLTCPLEQHYGTWVPEYHLDEWSFLQHVSVDDFHPKLTDVKIDDMDAVVAFLNARIAARTADEAAAAKKIQDKHDKHLNDLRQEIAIYANNDPRVNTGNYPYGQDGPYHILETLLSREKELSQVKEGVELFQELRKYVADQNQQLKDEEKQAAQELETQKKRSVEYINMCLTKLDPNDPRIQQLHEGLLDTGDIGEIVDAAFVELDGVGNTFVKPPTICEGFHANKCTVARECDRRDAPWDIVNEEVFTRSLITTPVKHISSAEYAEYKKIIAEMPAEHLDHYTPTFFQYKLTCPTCHTDTIFVVVRIEIELGHKEVGGTALIVGRKYVLTTNPAEQSNTTFNTNV